MCLRDTAPVIITSLLDSGSKEAGKAEGGGGEEEADQYLKRQFPRGYGIADVLNQYINPLSY